MAAFGTLTYYFVGSIEGLAEVSECACSTSKCAVESKNSADGSSIYMRGLAHFIKTKFTLH